ncbi:NAD(+) synthase [Gammaproteobacteria bacterium]|nr:NAD(+) synthase [Gammaproteobacteria bacterium]
MKICLGQINTTPGDFPGNLLAIEDGIKIAASYKADLVVFPELTITGYLSQDLLYDKDYIDAAHDSLKKVQRFSLESEPNLHVVLGSVARNPGRGKPFQNNAVVLNKGEIIGEYTKQLLPFYDVFDELRYFQPGTNLSCFRVKDKNVGIVICEDLWNDKDSDNYEDGKGPLVQYRKLGIDVLVSLNSSPYVQGKREIRFSRLLKIAQTIPNIVYVNQIGGQDELVFDGNSFVIDDGKLTFIARDVFDNSYPLVDIGGSGAKITTPKRERDSLKELEEVLVLGLRDYVKKSGFDQVTVASSGGVDSALVCKLACDAFGPEKVHAVRMPSIYSSDDSKTDALELHENLGCWDYEVPLDHEPILKELNDRYSLYKDQRNLVRSILDSSEYNEIADQNIQARLRDVFLMHFSNAFGAMPLSTGNKTESACGYYTHFDMNFSFAPIKDLYKCQVVQLAMRDSRIPKNVWSKAPSAELAFGQTDEDNLLPYSILDPLVMAYVEESIGSFNLFRDWCMISCPEHMRLDKEVLEEWLDSDQAPTEYERIASMIGKMEYKRRQTCPGTKVSKVAFGVGRRLPVVNKWS